MNPIKKVIRGILGEVFFNSPPSFKNNKDRSNSQQLKDIKIPEIDASLKSKISIKI